MTDMTLPLQYYSSIGIIQNYIPNNAIVIGEGSNTMDIGRTIITHQLPRSKLDSGTFATMGVGMGFCIAAKAIHPDRPVYAIVGDSAFGFSAMEIETATRYNLPIVVIIINNNGIFIGVDEISENTKNGELPVTALNPETKYEKLGEAFGARGILVNTHEELHVAMKEIGANPKRSYVVNVRISPMG
jgi:2-hydroxyacyl-CoA lyase 1